jgi:hypothetical protein
MQTIWKPTGNKLHTRNITVTTYNYDEQRIMVEGILKDDRPQEYHMVTGETLPPGVIHHMSIRILVDCSNLSVEDIDVDLISVPEKMCLETLGSLNSLKGLTITRGFTAKVKKLAGGKNGCTHLIELILVMAPAAFQGLIAYRAQKPSTFDPDRARRAFESLLNTCRAWKEDGPFVQKFKQLINRT